ncbi:MAG: DUF1549 domain-containing protein, partial [Aureliella sp.]
EIGALRAWIASGSPWSDGTILRAAPAADPSWWAFAPLSSQPAPNARLRIADSTPANAIDGFVEAARRAQGLTASERASPRELIRRATFDLTGLPPSPESVAAFVADARPDAYDRLIDRLLASPAFGERWARHWLDVVHYGESHGYDKDKPRLNAWPYRDYVIAALNSDKPYRRFIAEQVAGDVLWPDQAEAIEAVGFLAAGPWDFIGHAEVPETKLDGKTARHLDRDDMVQNTFLTFQSLTVGCAQCHDHKFDPITQREYYGLQAVFAALDRADRKFYRDPQLQSRFAQLEARRQKLETRIGRLESEIHSAGGQPLAELDKQLAEAKHEQSKQDGPNKNYPVEHGYHSAIASEPDQAKWVQIDLEKTGEIARIEWIACHDDFAGIGDGFGAPPRWRIELADSPDFSGARTLVADRTDKPQPRPGIAPQTLAVDRGRARFVRFTATELAPRQNDFIFALAELRVLDVDGNNVALGKPVAALDSIEAPPRWRASNLVDGKFPVPPDRDRLSELAQARAALLDKLVPSDLRSQHRRAVEQRAEVEQELAALPAPAVTYAATIYRGRGAFAGTAANGGRPRPIHLLLRGDISRPGPEVEPMALSAVGSLDPGIASGKDSSDAERRRGLAEWLTAEGNPLTWRSIANRIWGYHFHRGIVDTPNDFGQMGSLPSHPELLDTLAIDVRDHQSLKRLHRQIMLSATYQQSSQATDGEQLAWEVDPDNRWLARSPRRRLEAEAVRDAMLAVAGKLDRQMGGPSYQDFVIEHPEHSPHYQYALHDPRDPASLRRSVYRFIVRSQSQPLMTALDCADPSMQVDVRNESTSATQALSLLNNAFTLMVAEEWSQRVEGELKAAGSSSDQELERAVRRMFAEALAREPTDSEAAHLVALSQQHGLVVVARVVFNLNEFFYVD